MRNKNKNEEQHESAVSAKTASPRGHHRWTPPHLMLLKDAELRKKIGMNALARAKKFDHKHAAEKLEQVLKEGKDDVLETQ